MLSTNFQSNNDLRLDFNRDISFWLFGKPAVSLSAKLTKPAAAFFVFVTVPSHVLGVLFAGQMFADILFAVGYGFLIPYCLLIHMSLQKQLAKMILKKANTHYIFLASIVYTGSIAHKNFFEFDASFLTFVCVVPCYIVTVLFFFCMAMADASQENIRRIALRFFNPAACMIVLRNVLLVRLPKAEESTGYRTLWVLGVETVSNMDLTGKFGAVLLILLARGSWSAWRHPQRLAFFQARAVLVQHSSVYSMLAAPREEFIKHLSANVNPQALQSWNFLSNLIHFDDQNDIEKSGAPRH